MRRVVAVELLKVRRSPVVLVTTALVVVFVPLLSVGFVTLAESGGSGAAALKAQAMIVGEGWTAYLSAVAQIMSVTMFIGPGVVVAWAFGREFADRTFPSLFAMPVSRGSMAAAKFLVLVAWGASLTAVLLLASTLAGLIFDVGPIEDVALVSTLGRLFIGGFLTAVIALTVAVVASIGRGYLTAIGAVILLTAATQISVLLGTGGWFPYAAPGLYALAGADGVPEVGLLQLLLVPVTSIAVAWLTIRWWNRAEVVRAS